MQGMEQAQCPKTDGYRFFYGFAACCGCMVFPFPGGCMHAPTPTAGFYHPVHYIGLSGIRVPQRGGRGRGVQPAGLIGRILQPFNLSSGYSKKAKDIAAGFQRHAGISD